MEYGVSVDFDFTDCPDNFSVFKSASLEKNKGEKIYEEGENGGKGSKPLSLKEIFQIPGAKEIMISFFGYCALEQTASLWASSYLVLHRGLAEAEAAKFAGLFFLGITGGRFISGFELV